MAKSTETRPAGKAPAKPKKPGKKFPLRVHKGTGYWCKKVYGKVHYFGRVAGDPKGIAALEKWNRVKDDLLADSETESDTDAITVGELVNQFLEHHEQRRDDGEIAPRTWQALHGTCKNIVKVFGKARTVADLGPKDFAKLKKYLATAEPKKKRAARAGKRKPRGAISLRNEMGRARSVFRFAQVNNLISRPVRYGSSFTKPPLKQVRRNRREQRERNGHRMLTAAEIRQVLAAAGQPLRAMVLLAINGGMGQSDLANLPLSAIDLKAGLIDFPRPKTEADRLIPLWPETAQALREWLPKRRKAANPADAGVVFLTVRGARYVKTGPTGMVTDGIGQEFDKLLKRLGIKRPGVGFYALRHSFRTIADEVLDDTATALIMGHVDSSMAGNYRELVATNRLTKVTEHVRAWLFADDDATAGDEPASETVDAPATVIPNSGSDDRPRLRIVG